MGPTGLVLAFRDELAEGGISVSARALIFDLDGTLVDNVPYHVRAFTAFLERHGLPPLTYEVRRRLHGKRNADIFPILFGRELAEGELTRFVEEKEDLYRQLSAGRIAPLPGLLSLLALAANRGMPVAIATSAPSCNIPHSLGEAGLADRFGVIVQADDVARGKPHPDVFLESARRMGVAPADCVGFEDTPSGVEAVRAAGMECVALTTSFSADLFQGLSSPPDHIVRDFEEYLAGPGRWLAASTG
jgi:beta-phosphoglucomutase